MSLMFRDYILEETNSFFKKDGTRIIERKYSHGLTTREVDTTKINWYNKLINIKNDRFKQTSMSGSKKSN